MTQDIKCPKCKMKEMVVENDTKTNYFSFQYMGQEQLVKRQSKESDFFCYNCNEEFKFKKSWKKGQVLDALTVDVDFQEYDYKIKFVSKKSKPVLWIEIYNGNSNTYFCKVWGDKLVTLFENRDFSNGSVFTAELRLEKNQKADKQNSPFMALHFNSDTVDQRDDFY